MRRRIAAGSFPYLWTAEWHPGGHGLHVHFAVGRYVEKGLIEAAWDRGFVEIRRLNTDLQYASQLAKARVAAAYLGKYVVKAFERSSGLHRYEVAQGFQPRRLRFFADSMETALQLLAGATNDLDAMGNLAGSDYAHEAQAWADATCEAQVLSVKIKDPVAIRKVAVVFAEMSDAPNRTQPRGIEPLSGNTGATDDDVVQDGGDDGSLLMEIQIAPSAL